MVISKTTWWGGSGNRISMDDKVYADGSNCTKRWLGYAQPCNISMLKGNITSFFSYRASLA